MPNCILEDEYVNKEKIIKNIKKYYNTDGVKADNIFKVFLKNNVFVQTKYGYRIN